MKKIAYFVSISATIYAIATIITAIGLLSFGIYKLYESNESKDDRRETKSWLKYHNYISPKIDSLIEVNPQLAIKNIDRLIDKYPDIYFLELQKGLAYYNIDSLELAIIEFKKSMTKSGNEYPIALGYIGRTLAKLERYEEAIEVFNKAVKENSVYIIDIAQVYEMKKEFKSAIKSYEFRLRILEKDNDEFYKSEMEQLKKKIDKLKKEK